MSGVEPKAVTSGTHASAMVINMQTYVNYWRKKSRSIKSGLETRDKVREQTCIGYIGGKGLLENEGKRVTLRRKRTTFEKGGTIVQTVLGREQNTRKLSLKKAC